jgi:thiol-disulfide isomerase/thioredoxin
MRIAAALLLLVLSFSACEGGCGEAPKEAGSGQGSGQTVSGGSTGGGGGDAIPLTGGARRKAAGDNPLEAPKPETQAIRAAADVQNPRVQGQPGVTGTAGPAAATPGQPAQLSAVQEVLPADFDRIVLRGEKPVLLVYGTSSCRPCSSVEFQLGRLAKDYDGKVVFARMDLNKPGAYELMAPGLRRLPLPAFVFYQGGSPLNIRQGLPVPHDSSSLLGQWLRRVVDGRDVRLN